MDTPQSPSALNLKKVIFGKISPLILLSDDYHFDYSISTNVFLLTLHLDFFYLQSLLKHDWSVLCVGVQVTHVYVDIQDINISVYIEMICLFSSFKKNGLKKQNHTKVQKMLQTFLMWVKKKADTFSSYTMPGRISGAW